MSEVRTAPAPSVVDRINGVVRKVPPWPVYWAAALPPAWLLGQALMGRLGVEPIEVMEHQLGEWALQVLIASLCVTPLRRHAGLNLLKFRRVLGRVGFAYVTLHLCVWLFLDVQLWGQIWADIVKRPYITIGMTGFLLLVPLAATSSDFALRRMGTAAWRRLHKLTYLAITLGAVHWVMLSKGWQWEPILYLAAVVALVVLRIKPRKLRSLIPR